MTLVEFKFNPLKVPAADPYPTYAAMREAGGLLQSKFAVIAHRYEHVRHIQSDHEHFSMSTMGEGGMGPMGPMPEGDADLADFFLAQTMITSDPPDHERLRRVVNRAFTPRSIAGMEPHIRDITRRLLAPLANGEPFDIVADFAAPLPTIVIAELLGIPTEDAERFRDWSEAVTGTDVRGRIDYESAQRAQVELRQYLAQQVEIRKGNPTDDLIGRMVAANEEQVMTDAEVVASCVLLLVAGNETTMRLISNMTLALGRNPEQLKRLVADPELIASGVEETLRYDSPVQMLFRGAKTDTVVDGTEIPAGSMVLTMLAAANRDPDAFADPDVYDVGRTDNMHVSFGHGIHYCLGAPLARRETRIAFEELLDLAPDLRVLTRDEDLDYPPGAMLRSPKSLVVQA